MREKRAFTLVEVLVVLGVVALLMSLMIPGVQAAREASRSVECSARLREMATAARAYATVFREALPPAILYFRKASGVRISAWDFLREPDGTITPGALWSYTDDPGLVQQCPSYLGPGNFGTDVYSGYNYNTSFLGAEGSFPTVDSSGRVVDGWSAARKGLPAALHFRPSTTALFGDAGWVGGANKFMRSPSSTSEGDLGQTYAGAQAFRHQGCTNVAWLDGHVSGVCQGCKGMHASDALLASPLGWPENGFLSNDDSAYDPR